MKHKKSVSVAYIERDSRMIPELVRRAKRIAPYPTSMKNIYHIAAELPTDKFYIGDDAACDYIRKRIQNITPKFLSPYKQKLFEALYEEVTYMMKSEKYQKMGLKSTTLLALARPAPCVGLTPYILGLISCRQRKNNSQKKP